MPDFDRRVSPRTARVPPPSSAPHLGIELERLLTRVFVRENCLSNTFIVIRLEWDLLVRCGEKSEDVFRSANSRLGREEIPPLVAMSGSNCELMLPAQAGVAGVAAGKYHLETMETIDRAEEWRRLKELYLEKSDEELEIVADDAYELTDVAQQALEGEIARRGLKLEMRKAPEPEPNAQGNFVPDPSELNLVTLQQVFDREEAKRAKEALSNTGLPSFLGPRMWRTSTTSGAASSAVST